MNKLSIVMISCLVAGLTACADGPCHQVKYPELAKQATSSATTISAAPDEAKNGGTTMAGAKIADGHILVYKADGSQQCATAKGVKPADMAKSQLDGVKVYAFDNRSDGRMHVQVCGTPTGRINVFEIDQTSQAEAEKRGFKKLDAK